MQALFLIVERRKKQLQLPNGFITEKVGKLRVIRCEKLSQSEVLSIIREHENPTKGQQEKVIKKGAKSSIYLVSCVMTVSILNIMRRTLILLLMSA